ncbi:MAG TPA: flagellar hook-associated protein FlgK [Candidatus Limnocylindrales bacterium]
MSSPFYGLDIGASALRSAQQMLDTAAHNVANANTPGYSRQRVSVAASVPYTMPTFNRSGLPGQVGSGVTVTAITRVRDNFLDQQVQAQTTLKGEWDTRQQELAKIESIFPEPSDSGLGNVISKYWNAWQDVASDPTSTAARTALTEQAASLSMEFNRDSTQLNMVAKGIDSQVSSLVTTVNDLAKQIASLNGQIQRVTITGDHANDLMDQREQLLEQLSAILPANVLSNTDGTIGVYVGGTDLVSNVYARQMVATTDSNGHITPTWTDGSAVSLPAGQMKALLDVRDEDLAGFRTQLDSLAQGIADATNTIHQSGVDANGNAGTALFVYRPGDAAGTLAVNPAVAADPHLVAASGALDSQGDGSVAGLLADLRNAKSYSAGVPGTDITGGMNLSTNTTARLMTIATDTAVGQTYTFSSTSPNTLTLTGADGSTQTINVADMSAGGTQVLNFSQLGIKLTVSADAAGKSAADLLTDFTTPGHDNLVAVSLYGQSQTTSDFYASIVGKVGTESSQAQQMSSNQQLVVDQLNNRVSSASGVSLDEEATDMVRFQHAYQAAARVITTMDEMLNTLINGTGLVGRG